MEMQKSIWPDIGQPKQLINEYSKWIQDYVDKFECNPFLISLMFKPLNGNIMFKMTDEVDRVYSTFLTRVTRNPRSEFATESRPLLVAVPDLPVAKRKKQKLRDIKINNGLHMHGILVVPRNSRLKTDVVSHFKKHENVYVKNRLLRLHVEAVHFDLNNVVYYTFKSVKSAKFDLDHVLIFPKASTELRSQGKF